MEQRETGTTFQLSTGVASTIPTHPGMPESIDTWGQAWTLFDVLDVDGDHTINIDEFMVRPSKTHEVMFSVDFQCAKKGILGILGQI